MWLLTLLCAGLAVSAQEKAKFPKGPPKPVSFKRLETAHLYVYFTSEFREEAAALAEEGERFLKEIAGRWSVILPSGKMSVSIGRSVAGINAVNHLEMPPGVHLGYDARHGRIEIRVAKPSAFSLPTALPAYRHALLHGLLNLPALDRMPFFIEEGLARHYAGESSSRTRILAIIGFARYPQMAPFFESDLRDESGSEIFYAGALAGLFTAELWHDKPEAEVLFVQNLLTGKNWRDAVTLCGLGDWELRVAEFNVHGRARYRWYSVAYTLDFWVILFSTIALLWMYRRVWLAVRTARMEQVPVIIAQEVPVAADDLAGPAFEAPLPTPPPRRRAPAGHAPTPAPARPSATTTAKPAPAAAVRAAQRPSPTRQEAPLTAPTAPDPGLPPDPRRTRPAPRVSVAPTPAPRTAPVTPPRIPRAEPPAATAPSTTKAAGAPVSPPRMPPAGEAVSPPPAPGAARRKALQPGSLADALGNLDGSFDDAFRRLETGDDVTFDFGSEDPDAVFDDIEILSQPDKGKKDR